ncbi:hypothetical protein MRB53_010113 [Persea americana]|uniref:Uncharacterized protein n=1 Tax=Persea americana TaxID=3435 RepID=A0ACC2LQT9_PERAE|nr:hypothetical protein MRB53_010113 [Persea americana]
MGRRREERVRRGRRGRSRGEGGVEGEEEKEKEGGEGAMCVRVAAKRGGVYLAIREVATVLHYCAWAGAAACVCSWTKEGRCDRDGEMERRDLGVRC